MESLLSRIGIRNVPPHVIVLAAMVSYAGQAIAALQNWPLWGIVLATLIPWIPVFSLEMVWTYRHFQWLALYYLLVATQAGHFIEHLVQMVQIHVLHLQGVDARGIFGALDIEWVHFVWNTWVILAAGLLLLRFRSNPWLWATLFIAGWHEVEHAYIMSTYLRTGLQGTPGLLARGGAIGGGLPVTRPDLHFFYNLVETAPLFVGFAYQLRRSYNEWLAKAFPRASEEVLSETTDELEYARFEAGQTIVRQGDSADRFYIITQGEVSVSRQDRSGHEVEVATLRPGQFFGEIGLLAHTPRTATVRARTDVELLALDRETFRWVMESSTATAEDFDRVVRQRLAAISS